MKTRGTLPVLLLFAAGLLGSALHYFWGGSSPVWDRTLPSLYYLAIVVAAINLGPKAAAAVGAAAGALHMTAAGVGGGDWWLPLTETASFICIGIVTGLLVESRNRAVRKAHGVKANARDEITQDGLELRVGRQASALSQIIERLIQQFRTPLTSIEGACWLLDDWRLNQEKRAELVGIILKESHQLDRALSDLAEFNSPGEPRYQQVDLSSLVDAVIQLAGPKEHGPFFLFRKEIPSNLPHVRCDPKQIRQALLNLAVNAIQACPGGGQITIAARPEGDAVVIEVRDHGKGIPPAILDRIFEPFFTTRQNSLGLGLTVARQIVASHGGTIGTITVQDGSGEGTTLGLTLPLRLGQPPVTANAYEYGPDTGSRG